MVCCFPESPEGANTDLPRSDASQRAGTSRSPKLMMVSKQKKDNF